MKKSIPLHEISKMISDMKELNRLKVVLVEKKRTGKWLAEQLDKDPATISRWCSNSIQPSVETFAKIAELLNVDMRILFKAKLSDGKPSFQNIKAAFSVEAPSKDFFKGYKEQYEKFCTYIGGEQKWQRDYVKKMLE